MDNLIERLRSIAGAGAVLTGEGARLEDSRGVSSTSAVAVVRPASTSEVSEIVTAAAGVGVAVIGLGGHTGLSGGALPDDDRPTLVVSFQRMREIESVDVERSTMTVQAGATIQAMQDAAADADLLFAPDWGARGTATIGGAIGTDAGGNNVLRYGNMRDQVLGLEVVLGDGRVWNGLRALRKDSSGYDLKQLFIGAEGTLGLVTRAVVRLRPATPFQQSALAALTHLDQLTPLYSLLHAEAADLVTAFELVPDVGLRRVCEVFDVPRPIATSADWFVLVKLASSKPVTDALAALLDRATQAGHISDAIVAATADQEERLWFIRDELPPLGIYRDHQAIGLKLDTAVPLDRMGEFHERVRGLAADLAPDALAYGFGHVGDGNLHMMVLPTNDAHVEDFLAVKDELAARVDELVFEIGGTLSAEHGIGTVLRERIRAQKPAIEWELMRGIKKALDPNNLMNPGKVLPEELVNTESEESEGSGRWGRQRELER